MMLQEQLFRNENVSTCSHLQGKNVLFTSLRLVANGKGWANRCSRHVKGTNLSVWYPVSAGMEFSIVTSLASRHACIYTQHGRRYGKFLALETPSCSLV